MVYFQAPPASTLPTELAKFLAWVNRPSGDHPFIKTAVAHLWFITLHLFDDGNRRITRAITNMLLSRADGTSRRVYSMSAQIQKKNEEYYLVLEKTQKGSTDITAWLLWFLDCLAKAIVASEAVVDGVLKKAQFWQKAARHTLGDAQIKILTMLLDDFKGNLTSSKWVKICKVSQDTAGRDLKDLVQKGLLRQQGQGRSTHYVPGKKDKKNNGYP